jgi:lysophospholipid acyltransferase (LPLAT)-like uncharacterized protein
MYKTLKKLVAKTWLAELRIPVLSWGCDTGMTLLQLSWKMNSQIHPQAKKLIEAKSPVIYAVYHGRMAGILSIPDRQNTSILISNSRDGEMVARAMLRQGFLVSRGSPAHGALQATKSMLRNLRSGINVVVTVDGPRGPAMTVKPAVIRLAQVSQVPIVPMVADAKHVRVFGSWDSFLFPHFFTSMTSFYGEPLVVAPDSSIEELQAELDRRMVDLTNLAREHCRESAGEVATAG